MIICLLDYLPLLVYIVVFFGVLNFVVPDAAFYGFWIFFVLGFFLILWCYLYWHPQTKCFVINSDDKAVAYRKIIIYAFILVFAIISALGKTAIFFGGKFKHNETAELINTSVTVVIIAFDRVLNQLRTIYKSSTKKNESNKK